MDAILNVCINTNLNSSCFFWALCWFDAKQFIQHLAGDRVACWLFRLYCSLHHGTKNLSKNCICPFSFQNICQWKNNDWSSKVLLIQTRRNEEITQQKSRGRVCVMTKHAITGYRQQSSECICWENILGKDHQGSIHHCDKRICIIAHKKTCTFDFARNLL